MNLSEYVETKSLIIGLSIIVLTSISFFCCKPSKEENRTGIDTIEHTKEKHSTDTKRFMPITSSGKLGVVEIGDNLWIDSDGNLGVGF